MNQPRFRVDTRLAVLLSENYRSSEAAIKELVDNCWDADSDNVRITLPKPNTADPVVIEDDGAGMTPQELQSEYLVVAKNRVSTKGRFTTSKKRKVKGRKGIGKFAGLVTASTMQMETWARGNRTSIILNKDSLLSAARDLEDLDLVPTVTECQQGTHGTRITLSGLSQNLRFPQPENLRELLFREYGREEDFSITIDGERLSFTQIAGERRTIVEQIEGVGPVTLILTVADAKRPFKNAGIGIRVDGKLVGKPQFFGLENSEDFPQSVLGKVCGEIEADGLQQDVTADWGAVVENSKGFAEMCRWASGVVRESAKAVYGQEIQLAQARLQRKVNHRLAQLPDYKRLFAEKALHRILQKYYEESEEKLEPIVNVVLDAVERDEYYFIIEQIDKAKSSDIASFAEALGTSSLIEMSIMHHHLSFRLRIIDEIDELASNPATLEKHMHRAFENRLWLLGTDYTAKASNATLRTITEEYLNKKYIGHKAENRPDLLLSNGYLGNHTLIEFKRPSHTLVHDDYRQAIGYRHELLKNLSTLEVIVVGGIRDEEIKTSYTEDGVKFLTFKEVISNARAQFNWLRDQLLQGR